MSVQSLERPLHPHTEFKGGSFSWPLLTLTLLFYLGSQPERNHYGGRSINPIDNSRSSTLIWSPLKTNDLRETQTSAKTKVLSGSTRPYFRKVRKWRGLKLDLLYCGQNVDKSLSVSPCKLQVCEQGEKKKNSESKANLWIKLSWCKAAV